MIFKKHIRYSGKADWPLLQRFFKETFHGKHILANKIFFNWQFLPPFSKNKTPSVLILPAHRKILGCLGVIPVVMNYFGKKISVSCLTNFRTDPLIRGKGSGVDFIEKATEGHDMSYTLQYVRDFDVLLKHSGWKTDIFLKRYVKILNYKKVSELAERKIPLSDYSSNQTRPHDNFTFSHASEFDDRVDALWRRLKYKYPITIIRSREYLNWRYSKHPFFNYHLFFVRDGEKIQSFVVLRIEKFGSYTAGRIIDFISTDDAEVFTLKKLVEFCREHTVDFIDFFFTGDFHVPSLELCGFKEAHKKPYSLIPIRFDPIDRNIMTINLAYKILNSKRVDRRINQIDNWYVTKGDGDQDRPNPH